MKKITLGALALLTIATACRDDSYSLPAKSSTNLVTPTLHTRVNGSQSPLTGIVEAYPCLEGSSIYFGNYVNNTLSVFYGFYNVLDGNITGDYNREVSLPVGNYNIVYWGTPKYEEPIHTTPAIVEPGLTLGADLSQLYFSLRKNSQDTTYIPVYDMVHVNKEVIIGQEDLEANMNRVVAGLKVIVKTKKQRSHQLKHYRYKGTDRWNSRKAELVYSRTQQHDENSTVQSGALYRQYRNEQRNGHVVPFCS